MAKSALGWTFRAPKVLLVPARGLVSIEPTERCVWSLVAIAVLGTASAGLPLLEGPALALAVGLALGVIADVWLAGSPRRIEVARVVPEVFVQGQAVPVALELFAPSAVRVEVTDALPPAAALDGRGDERSFTRSLAARERTRVPLSLVLYRRGEARFGRLTVRTLGPLGLVRRRVRHELSSCVRVVPDLGRIGARAERLLRGQDAEGRRRQRVPKEGREFESLREYRRGDDPRRIDWKASARQGELIVRRLMPETRQDVLVLLDVGRQLAGRHEAEDGGAPRLDVSLQAAFTLAAAALVRGDRVGALAFAGDVTGFVPPLGGRGQLGRFAAVLGGVQCVPEEADYGAAAAFVRARQKRRALIAFVTDVLDEPSARALAGAVAQLRGRHLPLVVALGDPALMRLCRGPIEGEAAAAVQLAAERLLAHRRAALAALESAGAIVVDAPASRAPAKAVQAYLAVKGSGRL